MPHAHPEAYHDMVTALAALFFAVITFYPFIASGLFSVEKAEDYIFNDWIHSPNIRNHVFPVVSFLTLTALTFAITAFWAEARGPPETGLASSTLYLVGIGFYIGNVIAAAFWTNRIFFAKHRKSGILYLVMSTVAAAVLAVIAFVVAERANDSSDWLWVAGVIFALYFVLSVILCGIAIAMPFNKKKSYNSDNGRHRYRPHRNSY